MALSKEEEMLKERMRFVLAQKKMSLAKFADGDENARVRYSHQINGSGSVPFSTLYKMLYMFDDIDANWLVLNEGSMSKADHVAPRVYTQNNNVHDNRAGGNVIVGSGTHVVPSLQKFEELQKRIAELEHDKSFLEGMLAALTKK